MIPVSQPFKAPKSAIYLAQCARSGWFSAHGTFVKRFEDAFADWLGVDYAMTVTSGTAALHVALAACNISKGDEVIVPTFTMFSPVAAILYTGATPVFVDSDPKSWTLNPIDVAKKISKRTRAILAVHIYGHPVDMNPLQALAAKHKLFLIEDAAEGLGAKYKGKKVGTLSDIACFSFYANKVVTTGEGGMVTTSNARLASRVRLLRDMSHDPNKRFRHTELGFTYRMTNMQAAVGLASLEQIEKTIAQKKWVASLYNSLLLDFPYVSFQTAQPWANPVWWMVGILVPNRDELRKKLFSHSIDTRDFFVPSHRQPALKLTTRLGYPIADRLSRHGLYLPSGPDISEKDLRSVVRTIKQIYEHM